MAVERTRSGLLVVDLLVELNSSWSENTLVYCAEDGALYIKGASGYNSLSGSSSGVSDGDKGDITVSGGGTTWTVDSGLFAPAVHNHYHAVTTLANNQATAANTTPVILTGMSFSYAINSIYIIRVLGSISSAAATTGAGFQLDVSSVVTQIAMNFFHQLANTGTITGGSSIADNASAGVSSGLPALNTAIPVSVQGILRTGANTGTAQLMYRSETTAVTTALAGLTMIVEKIA